MEEKNVVLDIIIEFVKALKNKDGAMETNINGTMYKIWNCKYLLNQILRQWHTPNERWYISKKAKDLWDKLNVGKPIENYHYTDKVICNNEIPVEVKIFKGSSNHFDTATLKKGCHPFNFNSIFHEEHIVPISVIIEQLCNLNELNYKNVEEILNKISICRILKEEDKDLNANHSKKNRPCDPIKVLNETYKKAGIELHLENKNSTK